MAATPLLRLLPLGPALLAAACGGGSPWSPGGGGDSPGRLERLVFVPARACVLLPETERPVDCSNPRALLVDRFEVTQEEWRAWLDGLEPAAEAHACLDFWSGNQPAHPATGMTLGEARDFAAGEGMRLPSAREWVRIATGTRAQYFPWGRGSKESVANTLELRLRALAPVGTFESGATPSGVYDLLGNAREWVLDDLLPAESRSPLRAWAMGGSFLARKRATYWLDESVDLDGDGRSEGNTGFNAILLGSRARARDVGLRLVADAEAWLRAEAPGWGTDEATRRRLERIGEGWGSAAIGLLEGLAAEPEAARGLEALLRGARR